MFHTCLLLAELQIEVVDLVFTNFLLKIIHKTIKGLSGIQLQIALSIMDVSVHSIFIG